MAGNISESLLFIYLLISDKRGYNVQRVRDSRVKEMVKMFLVNLNFSIVNTVPAISLVADVFPFSVAIAT